MNRCRCLAAVLLAAWASSAAPAQENGTTLRLDAHGDPLPEGAIARLGTTRFRTGLVRAGKILFLHGDKGLLSGGEMGAGVRIWDVAGGKELRRIGGAAVRGPLALSHDGKIVAASKGFVVTLWDVASGAPIPAGI
jgi:hypothetical protein